MAGTPEGASFEMFDDLCGRELGEGLRSARYVPISGWKASGAYRVQLRGRSGRRWAVVYKVAEYGVEAIPALAAFPVRPGVGEFLVYGQAGEALAGYLPKVYGCWEDVAGRRYRYVLEDLTETYGSSGRAEAVVRAAGALPSVHRALAAWGETIDVGALPVYDAGFTAGVSAYARENLARYEQAVGSAAVSQVLRAWDRIAAVHTEGTFRDVDQMRVIHGDYNCANVLAHKRQPERIKLVDWEWAGMGMAEADLASLLNHAEPQVEAEALAAFAAEAGTAGPAADRRRYEWCQLERGLVDASFLAVQYMDGGQPARFSVPQFVDDSLNRVLRAWRELT